MSQKKHQPYVPESMKMTEFTVAAVGIGLVMSIILGAANAYLGLKAGITIAATYPAAVIGMALLRAKRGTILEENLARTAGSIGESIAAGAIFTLPAFVISKSWPAFDFEHAYLKSTALMLVGGVLGVLFVSLVRRALVEDDELPFPESVAAAEIHKAGQTASGAAKYLFYNMVTGAGIYFAGVTKLFEPDHTLFFSIGELGRGALKLGGDRTVATGAYTVAAAPSISPAYIGVGYIIGPRLAALNFAGGVLAWGLFIPMLMYFLGPNLAQFVPAGEMEGGWTATANAVWRYIVRPIAVGGMLVGAGYTLFRMRKNLLGGLSRAFAELRGGGPDPATLSRTEQYMSFKVVFALIGLTFLAMVGVYTYFAGALWIAAIAAVVMLVTGFLFTTVSGSLVGFIGSSNNPISGLTLSTLLIAALLMVSLGVNGATGVATVLAVAAVVCVAAAVGGELLQDFKAGYILGGTPRTIQWVELLSVVISALVMFFPVMLLHQANIKQGGIGFGDAKLPAPQAGLMALIAQGIVGGEMAWPLVVMGIFMGIGMIMLQVKSPMLVAVGMYLPLATTFAIFVGGCIRSITDYLSTRAGHNEAQKARIENTGVLVSSGLIAGEGLMGLVVAAFALFEVSLPEFSKAPSYAVGLAILGGLAVMMIRTALGNAGRPEDPAPPSAMV
ncbi:MAG: oligopeptide transporter, OPT family [Acidobacteria bacterium]|jgi:putative OPT family oligopeptide transporter|nr:oligopeptide transporter, OPT family [Bryobacteraceae bacterium CoA2 C42]